MNGSRVLVTGAGGFVGRWLVPALARRGDQVFCLVKSAGMIRDFSKNPAQIIGGDVCDLTLMRKVITDSRIDIVFHLAAINTNTGTTVPPYDIFETNIRGVYTVLEACRTAPHPAGVVVASSKEVEDCFTPGAVRKHHPYMTSKAAAELVTRAYGETFDIPVAIVRSDNLYGGGDLNWTRLVPGTIRSVLENTAPVIRSNGLLKRDYVYVEDAVAGLIAVADRLSDPAVKGRLFRLATGSPVSVLNLVERIIAVAGRPGLKPRVLGEDVQERVDTLYAPDLERKVLGWNARHSLDEGLARTSDWYRRFLSEGFLTTDEHR